MRMVQSYGCLSAGAVLVVNGVGVGVGASLTSTSTAIYRRASDEPRRIERRRERSLVVSTHTSKME